MHSPRRPLLARRIVLPALALASLGATGCGGQITFQGKAPMTVAGDPPMLPAPPPPPAPEPPKPPPRVALRDNKIEITEKIQFEVNKAIIKEESFSLLNEIADVIKQNPHVKKVSIEGHASAEGDKKRNLKLSDDRAKSVMEYLVTKGGIAKERLTAKGFGVEKPIAPNDTEEGREKNRRVEFNVTEQDVTKKKVEIDPTTGKERVIEETKATEAKPADTKPAEPAADAAKKASDKAAADAAAKKASDKAAADAAKKASDAAKAAPPPATNK
jgi:OOP family OmpA-OmpF porin